MDAWLPKYECDPQGHSLIVVRNPVLNNLLEGGHEKIRAASLRDKMMVLITREKAIHSHLKQKLGTMHRDLDAGVRRLEEIIRK